MASASIPKITRFANGRSASDDLGSNPVPESLRPMDCSGCLWRGDSSVRTLPDRYHSSKSSSLRGLFQTSSDTHHYKMPTRSLYPQTRSVFGKHSMELEREREKRSLAVPMYVGRRTSQPMSYPVMPRRVHRAMPAATALPTLAVQKWTQPVSSANTSLAMSWARPLNRPL